MQNMNVYARYFDNEVLTTTFEELWEFIHSIEGGMVATEQTRLEVQEYVEGKYSYAKRFKVNSRSYFILIKTTATTLTEFKEYANRESTTMQNRAEIEKEKDTFLRAISEEKIGWYEASIQFKRVVPQEVSGKFQYINTEFSARLKARSVQDCYDRILAYLKLRKDIDPRSQFPSIKGRNFIAQYQGV